MDDAIHAMQMGFAGLVFVIALTIAALGLSKAKTTADVVIYSTDATNFYENMDLNEEIKSNNGRVVGIETIIPTLYRYYNENFGVKIYNSSDELIQIFDIAVETDTRKAISTIESRRTDRDKLLVDTYGDGTVANLFGAPWMGNKDRDAKTRIDYFINGTKGYINGAFVDYTTNNLKSYANAEFVETFVEYDFSGATITTGSDEGQEESLDILQGSSKVDIIFKQI